MNIELLIKELNKQKKSYGDIKITELVEKLTGKSNSITIDKLKINTTTYYGQGMNEMAGEEYSRTYTLLEVLDEIIDCDVTVANSQQHKENKSCYYTLSKDIKNELSELIHNGWMGNDHEISYSLEFKERTPTVEEITKYLSKIRVTEEFDDIRDMIR